MTAPNRGLARLAASVTRRFFALRSLPGCLFGFSIGSYAG